MFWTVTMSLLNGFGATLKIFLLTLLFALPRGLIISFGSMSKIKPIKWVVKIFVWIIRGTPLMLQLIAIYYFPGLAGAWAAKLDINGIIAWIASWNIPDRAIILAVFYLKSSLTWIAGWTVPDRFLAVMVAFVINYSCYFSEIYRGGIESMSKGQYEAGQVLGLSKIQVFFKIILFQVIKKIVPPMSNEIITLVKDTSLARIIAVREIIMVAQNFISARAIIWPLFYSGLFYLTFCGILTVLFRYIERKLDYYRG